MGLRSVMEYGALTVFFVGVFLFCLWLSYRVVNVVLMKLSVWVDKQVELMDSIKTTVGGIESSIKAGEEVAKDISENLQEHTNILKQDGSMLREVKTTTDRIELKLGQLKC